MKPEFRNNYILNPVLKTFGFASMEELFPESDQDSLDPKLKMGSYVKPGPSHSGNTIGPEMWYTTENVKLLGLGFQKKYTFENEQTENQILKHNPRMDPLYLVDPLHTDLISKKAKKFLDSYDPAHEYRFVVKEAEGSRGYSLYAAVNITQYEILGYQIGTLEVNQLHPDALPDRLKYISEPKNTKDGKNVILQLDIGKNHAWAVWAQAFYTENSHNEYVIYDNTWYLLLVAHRDIQAGEEITTRSHTHFGQTVRPNGESSLFWGAKMNV